METFKARQRNHCAGSHRDYLCFHQSQLTFYYNWSQHTETVQLWDFKILENTTGRKLKEGKTGDWGTSNKKMNKKHLESLYSLDVFTWLICRKMQRRGRTVIPSVGLTTVNEFWPRQTQAVSQQTDFHCSLEVRKCCCLEKYQLYPRNCQLLLSTLPLKTWPIAQKSTWWPWSQWLVVVKQYL